MTILKPQTFLVAWPDHKQLPETDGTFVQNFQEHPQSILLTDCIQPLLDQLHPDHQYAIGQDSGIYWDLAASLSDDPVRGSKAPDWFYVPGVPPMLDGEFRRSYVLWKESVAPLVVLEFVSGDGREEHDRTPGSGKFWVYERAVQAQFYGIFDAARENIELYELIDGEYFLVSENPHDQYEISSLGVALGLWRGTYRNQTATWMRWYNIQGDPLPTSDERADAERQRADTERQRADAERQRADAERQRADRLAEMLRALGVDPETHT